MTIRFHEVLHGFRAGCGTGSTSLESKILQYLMSLREAVLHKIFLNIQKAYIALYRDSCLNILTGYGMVPRELRVFRIC